MRGLIAALLAAAVWTVEAGAQSLPNQTFPTVADHFPSQLLLETYGTVQPTPPGLKLRGLAPIAVDLIKDFENWVPTPYNDAAGNCTIGFGHLIAPQRCETVALGRFAGGLTEIQGLALLDEDTRLARIAVQQLVTAPLNDDQFGALTSFVFNVGRTNFGGSTMLVLLNAKKYNAAADQFPRWVQAGAGVVLPGLVQRRSCEQLLYRGELTVTAGGHISRELCKAPSVGPDLGTLIDIYKGEKR